MQIGVAVTLHMHTQRPSIATMLAPSSSKEPSDLGRARHNVKPGSGGRLPGGLARRRPGRRSLGTGPAPALALLLAAAPAWAQSAATIEAIGLHKPAALTLARQDLEDCERLACPRRAHLALLVGQMELSAGDAATALARLASQPPPPRLEAFHAFYLGQAAFYTRDYARAARHFAAALSAAPPSLEARARARLGEAALAAGDPALALAHLERAATELDLPELYAQRSAARQARGDRAGARADLRTLALRFPAHPDGVLAAERLAAERARPLTLDERLTRAWALLASDPAAALAELSAIDRAGLARTASARAKAALVAAGALYAQGKDAEAERQVTLARRGAPEVAAQAALLAARRALKRDDNARARKLMTAIDRRYGATRPAEEAGFFVGWLDFQAGEYEAAVKGFEAFERRHPRARRRDEAVWFRALCLLQLRRYPEARAELERLVRRFPRSKLVPQALYWTARSRQLEADAPGEVAPAYTRLIERYPGSFHGWLAQARLRELGREPPVAFPSAPRVLEVQVPEPLELAAELRGAGLLRDADEAAQRALAAARTPELALAYGHALQRLGEFGHAHALAARALWGRAFTERAGEALALFYPRPFDASVQQAARQEGVEPHLVWSIMRRESAFRPGAHSAADARGLMQVMPATAAAIAGQMAKPVPAPDELFSPDFNIRLGAWYLARLTRRFQHPALVAAAYNAGPAAVLRWLQRHGSLPLDLFVELIPYRETRGYVKQVVADLNVYRALYGAPPDATAMFELPAPLDSGVDF